MERQVLGETFFRVPWHRLSSCAIAPLKQCTHRWCHSRRYSCGGQAGKGGRAFHLEMVEPVRQEAIKVLSERDVQRMALAQFGSRKTKIIS